MTISLIEETYRVSAGEKITGVVLAGGRGSRLGGRDKGLIQVAARPLVEHVLARLAPQVDEIIINANRHGMEYARYDLAIVADCQTDAGPLAGMLAALASARYPLVLCVPCDAARLPLNLATRLRAKLNEARLDACAVHDGSRVQPVCCLLRRHLESQLSRFIEQGGRAVHAWLNTLCWGTVEFGDWPRAFWSVNTPAQLRQLSAELNNFSSPNPLK